MWTGIVLSLALAQAQPAVPTVKATNLNENRGKQLLKEDGFFYSNNSSLSISAQLQGPTAKEAVKIGNLKVSEATDDLKADLVRTGKDAFDSYNDTNQPAFRTIEEFSRRGKDKDVLSFFVQLAAPARAAKKVSAKGSIDLLVGGKVEAIEFPKLRSLEGTQLKHADLDSAGLKLNVVKPEKNAFKPEQHIVLKMEGDEKALNEFVLVDAAGKKIEGAHVSTFPDFKDRKIKNVTVSMQSAIPADAKLQIKLLKGFKTVTVPFEFKDIELP